MRFRDPLRELAVLLMLAARRRQREALESERASTIPARPARGADIIQLADRRRRG
jgi:hypothetical protein